jgi:hypothetical protein
MDSRLTPSMESMLLLRWRTIRERAAEYRWIVGHSGAGLLVYAETSGLVTTLANAFGCCVSNTDRRQAPEDGMDAKRYQPMRRAPSTGAPNTSPTAASSPSAPAPPATNPSASPARSTTATPRKGSTTSSGGTGKGGGATQPRTRSGCTTR